MMGPPPLRSVQRFLDIQYLVEVGTIRIAPEIYP